MHESSDAYFYKYLLCAQCTYTLYWIIGVLASGDSNSPDFRVNATQKVHYHQWMDDCIMGWWPWTRTPQCLGNVLYIWLCRQLADRREKSKFMSIGRMCHGDGEAAWGQCVGASRQTARPIGCIVHNRMSEQFSYGKGIICLRLRPCRCCGIHRTCSHNLHFLVIVGRVRKYYNSALYCIYSTHSICPEYSASPQNCNQLIELRYIACE